jgi:hypothetical protein
MADELHPITVLVGDHPIPVHLFLVDPPIVVEGLGDLVLAE